MVCVEITKLITLKFLVNVIVVIKCNQFVGLMIELILILVT